MKNQEDNTMTAMALERKTMLRGMQRHTCSSRVHTDGIGCADLKGDESAAMLEPR